MNLEGDIDGLMARLDPTQGSTSTFDDTLAELRFEGDTFSGFVQQKEAKTEITGFKFGKCCLLLFNFKRTMW